ncbi:MAG: signal peptidase I [Chloroflexi bacterium]|nr:signal peptidase I [Chloroflexota bacterium]
MKTGTILLRLFLGVLGLVIVLLSAGCGFVQVKGHSMEPTISEGERLTVDKNAYAGTSAPQRGDIILFDQEGTSRISRVVGLPGETITIDNGAVYVNGNKLDEPYLAAGTRTESATKNFQVPGNSYFVLGDNRGQSNDSRAIGSIPRDGITGKVPR